MAILRMQDPRQLYGLGSLVKKAIRGVKKIVKSPIGKAALIGGGAYFAPTLWGGAKGLAGWKGLASKFGPSIMGKTSGGGGFFTKGLGRFLNPWSSGKFSGKHAFGLGAAALTAMPFLMKGDEEEEEEEESWTNVPSSIADIRNQAKNYYTLGSAGSNLNFMPQKQFVDANYYAADGGRARLAPGGPAGGASAGGNYGGNVNPEQEYAGSTFEETYGGDNTNNTVVVNEPPVNPVIDNTVIDNTVPDNLMAGLTKKQMMLLDQRKNMYPDILGAQEMLDNISSEDDPDDPATIQNIKDYYAGTYVGAQGGRVGLLNGGEAGQEQIEQMLMAEYIKYKNQGGQLTFEQFVQAVMQQQEGGMEQPQELPQEGEVIYAADGGRAGYAGGQLVRPSADGSRPGYSGIMEGIIAAFGKGMDKSIPKRKKDEDLTRDEAERIKMAVFEVLDQTAGGEKSTLSGTFIDNLGDSLEQFVRPDLSAYIKDYTQGTGIFAKDFIFGGKDDILKKAHGGRIGYNRGRVVNPGGYAGEEEGNIQLLWEAIKKQFDPAHWVDMFNFFSGKSGEINSSGFPPNLEIGEGFGSEALLPEDLKAHGGRIGLLSGGLLDDDEDETTYNPYAATKMYRRMGKQEGGIMESEAAEEMINMNGQEKDYRETGGFVNLGGKERADDVPARLSKNEFVFTADAVRAAGGGDIDAGSEVMQNMMDNLEQGGEISEESQGLEGAQAMYDQQQMLQSRIA